MARALHVRYEALTLRVVERARALGGVVHDRTTSDCSARDRGRAKLKGDFGKTEGAEIEKGDSQKKPERDDDDRFDKRSAAMRELWHDNDRI